MEAGGGVGVVDPVRADARVDGREAAAVVALVLGAGLVFGLWLVQLAPPEVPGARPLWWAATIAWWAGAAVAWRRPAFRATLRRWRGSVVCGLVLLLFLVAQTAWPASDGEASILLGLVLAAALLAGLGVGFAHLRTRPADAALTIALTLLVIGAVPVDKTSLRFASFRVRVDAAGWQQDAERLLRDDTAPVETLPSWAPAPATAEPFVIEGAHGRAVGWKLAAGIPGRAWGAVYDPAGVTTTTGFVRATWGTPFNRSSCDPIGDAWYWCRFA